MACQLKPEVISCLLDTYWTGNYTQLLSWRKSAVAAAEGTWRKGDWSQRPLQKQLASFAFIFSTAILEASSFAQIVA